MHRRRFIAGLAATCLGLPPAHAATDAPQAREPLTLLLPVPEGGSLAMLGHSLAECLGNAVITSLITPQWPSAPAAITRFISEYGGRGDAMLVAGSGLVGATIAARQATGLGDLAPVARLTTEYAACAVRIDAPFASIAELMAAMRATPDQVTFCGGSPGSTDQILAAMINRHAGRAPQQLRYRPYVGGVGAVDAVLGGTTSCVCGGLGELQNHVSARQLRLLGLAAPQRLPGVPAATFVEQGLDIELSNWRGAFAPPGIDRATLERRIQQIDAAVGVATWKSMLFRYNWTGDYLAGAAFGAFVREDTMRIRHRLAQLGL